MITVGLVGGGDPPDVQIVIDTVAAGAPWRVTGTTGSWTWTVPGGEGVGSGGQLVLLDNRAPGNTLVTYSIDIDGTAQSAAAIRIPFSGEMVLQSLDGSLTVPVEMLKGSADTTRAAQQAQHRVKGRRRPVIRYDVTGDLEGTLRLLVRGDRSADFDSMIRSGQPLVWRLGRKAMDLPPVAVFAYADLKSEAYRQPNVRVWEIPYALVDDPILDLVFGSPAWDDVEAILSGLTWDEFDARFSGGDWDELDRLDWENF